MTSKTIDRRKVIAGTTALAALGPLPLQAAEADGEIARLFAVYMEAERRLEEADAIWDEARGDAVAAARTKLGIPRRKGTDPISLRAIEEWEAAIAKQVDALGLAHLETATEDAENAYHEAWEALSDAPAKSITGIAIKLAAATHWDEGSQDIWTGKRYGEKGQRMVLAVRADALRLADLPHAFGMDEPESEYQGDDDEEVKA